eukprot:Skav209038  [mRNA]  locus=scaffold2483:104847:106401:+ [translate_table: standard]
MRLHQVAAEAKGGLVALGSALLADSIAKIRQATIRYDLRQTEKSRWKNSSGSGHKLQLRSQREKPPVDTKTLAPTGLRSFVVHQEPRMVAVPQFLGPEEHGHPEKLRSDAGSGSDSVAQVFIVGVIS